MHESLLRHISELVKLEHDEKSLINACFKPLHFRKRQYVLQEGQMVDRMFFVRKGLLKSSFYDEFGKEHILQFASENWWVSDFAAFYKREAATLSLDCIEDAELLSISYDDLELLCEELPKMEHFFRKKNSFGYVSLQQRILSLIARSAKDRYHDFCVQYPDIVQRVPKQLIANYLGLSRETLSRLHL